MESRTRFSVVAAEVERLADAPRSTKTISTLSSRSSQNERSRNGMEGETTREVVEARLDNEEGRR